MKLTVDIVIFTILNEQLQLLLIQRLLDPFKNEWALPGGFILENETTENAAKRELLEETSLHHNYLEQLYTFSEPDRDPRERIITTAYMAVISYKRNPI